MNLLLHHCESVSYFELVSISMLHHVNSVCHNESECTSTIRFNSKQHRTSIPCHSESVCHNESVCISTIQYNNTAAVSALPCKQNLLFPTQGLPLGSAVPFLLLALWPGICFLSLFAKYTCWSLHLLPLCPQDHYVWLRLGWERFWVGNLEGVLYKTTVIRIT